MGKFASAFVVLALTVLMPGGTAAAQAQTQDSADGNGAADPPYGQFEFSATSSPVGGSPSGTASFSIPTAGYHIEGTVSCLAVTGNRAVIGMDVDTAASSGPIVFQGIFLTVVDGGPAGSGLDSFDALPTVIAGAGDTVPDGLLVRVLSARARSSGHHG